MSKILKINDLTDGYKPPNYICNQVWHTKLDLRVMDKGYMMFYVWMS